MTDTPPQTPSEMRRQRIRARLGGRSVVLVGMMGAGKSAVGKRLGQELNLPFKDADLEIEAAAKMTIPDIFAQHGEPFFRDKERRVIARLLGEAEPIVLATGGGAFMNEETRALVAACAVSIWLKADVDTLMKRVRRKSNRPLLQTADPEGTLREILARREPVYAEAMVTVQSRDVPHEVVLEEVLHDLDGYLGEHPHE
ncbi:MAG: shikimate kinase [Labrys sp. (in: a-proteobacteria)]|jgi:shikimate kinase